MTAPALVDRGHARPREYARRAWAAPRAWSSEPWQPTKSPQSRFGLACARTDGHGRYCPEQHLWTLYPMGVQGDVVGGDAGCQWDGMQVAELSC